MNGLARASEPASPLFRFRFQNIFLGPLCYRDFEEIGPWRGKIRTIRALTATHEKILSRKTNPNWYEWRKVDTDDHASVKPLLVREEAELENTFGQQNNYPKEVGALRRMRHLANTSNRITISLVIFWVEHSKRNSINTGAYLLVSVQSVYEIQYFCKL